MDVPNTPPSTSQDEAGEWDDEVSTLLEDSSDADPPFAQQSRSADYAYSSPPREVVGLHDEEQGTSPWSNSHWDMTPSQELQQTATSVTSRVELPTLESTPPANQTAIAVPMRSFRSPRSSSSLTRRPSGSSINSNDSPLSEDVVEVESSHSGVRRRYRRTTPLVPETIEERRSLRQSLDAGMASLRRWMRQQPTTNTTVLSVASQRALSARDDWVLGQPPHESPTMRQRALSEPEGIQLRDYHFQRAVQEPPRPADDSQREARLRWYILNRRFLFIITIVALIFSLLLFAILVCWVVLTSAYVVSLDKSCDVPLKRYFWLATLQLVLDVFRSDLMRFVCRWDSNTSSERIPARVIVYNVGYLIYALLVLRTGIHSVFLSQDSSCPSTAPELYRTSRAFVSLSVAAWATIVFGYLVPFCFIATLLTLNGYHPGADDTNEQGQRMGVFPAAYSNNGAPAGTIHLLRTVLFHEFPPHYPSECCICMTEFVDGDTIVATECDHVFHKRCCQEWLKQARTCPVCRMDIPNSLENRTEATPALTAPGPSFPGRQDLHEEVANLIRIWRGGREDGHEVELSSRADMEERRSATTV